MGILPPLLELRGIEKSFGTVHALRGADFSLEAGEVHALAGENGAGKSTLMHIAFGMLAADAGKLLLGGQEVSFRSPRDARAHGIGMVHQHFTSIDGLTVAENLALAVGARGIPARSEVAEQLRQGLRPEARAGTLSVAERQRLEILKALATGARILLLDEPTALLAPAQVEELLGIVRAIADGGGAVALITHKLGEVLAVADRVTVLRQGRVTLRSTAGDQTQASLAAAMIGEGVRLPEPGPRSGAEPPKRPGPVAARLAGIDLLAGELIGIAAVEGNGQRELLRSLAGIDPISAATALVPVAFVPEDRTTEGLIAGLTVTENMILGLDRDSRWVRGRRIDWRAAGARTRGMIEEFGIRAPGPDAVAGTLSGGNQQKLVLARALESHPGILVAENPTRGLDLRTTMEMHRRLREATAAGVTVVVYSTDLDEVLGLADRVLVVRAGVVREAPAGADRGQVGEMMLVTAR